MDKPPEVTPDWRAALVAAVAKHPRGKAGVAGRLGFTRSYVSRALATGTRRSGYTQGVPQSFIDRVTERLIGIECPATFQLAIRSQCLSANHPAPTHNPLAMRTWRECQTCSFRPAQSNKEP